MQHKSGTALIWRDIDDKSSSQFEGLHDQLNVLHACAPSMHPGDLKNTDHLGQVDLRAMELLC